MKFVLPLCFLITICCACENDSIISWQLTDTSKSIRLTIPGLPNENPWIPPFKRRILFYSSSQDLLDDVNPIDEQEMRVGFELSQVAYSDNIMIDEVYVRVYSNNRLEPAVFRVEDPIVMSKTKGVTVFIVDENNVIREE